MKEKLKRMFLPGLEGNLNILIANKCDLLIPRWSSCWFDQKTVCWLLAFTSVLENVLALLFNQILVYKHHLTKLINKKEPGKNLASICWKAVATSKLQVKLVFLHLIGTHVIISQSETNKQRQGFLRQMFRSSLSLLKLGRFKLVLQLNNCFSKYFFL